MQKYLGKGSGWINDTVIDHTISILRQNSLNGSSYIKLTKELDHPRKALINIHIQNIDDNECLKWCLVRYLNLADHHAARITKADRDFAKTLYFKDKNFPFKIRDIRKIENRKSIGISVVCYKNKEKISNLCIKKTLQGKTCSLIIDWSWRKKTPHSYKRS